MTISVNWIFGMCLGAEYVEPFDNEGHTVIVDIFIVRVLLQW